ncbi:inositol 1,4,5-triphosphate receptor-interacting protein [Plakobranchus ocellatus]|uniref:Inositol 1,4,5-triphosphate receptor-interacting protein n=1 Tax=Plakobranchus ocellatus TaxID=259542 RepID=A0AAV3Z3Q8_9GAST|nr:inositol 1,4,5-triphosphate receptor-interacting protein [Plakobranchus ocellatus]
MEHVDLNTTGILSSLPSLSELIGFSESFIQLSKQFYYDVALAVSITACQKPFVDHTPVHSDKQMIHDIDEETENSNIFDTLSNFFNFDTQQKDASEISSNQDEDHSCQPFIEFSTAASPSLHTLVCVVVAAVALITFIYFVCFILLFYKSEAKKTEDCFESEPMKLVSDFKAESHESEIAVTSDLKLKQRGDHESIKPVAEILIITRSIRDKAKTHPAKTCDIFKHTLQRYLKEVDISLAMCSFSNFDPRPASSPASQDNVSCLTSPRLPRRNLSQNSHSRAVGRSFSLTDSIMRNEIEDTAMSWIEYSSFKKRMCWEFSKIDVDSIKISDLSEYKEGLAIVLQFLHQTCPINPRQWDIATSVVSYSLFILEHELRDLCRVTEHFLDICRFEPSGSASNGTLIGSADRFDVMLICDIPACLELMVLHSNISDEVPPGHVVLGVKENKFDKESLNYLRKACIQGKNGFYLQTQTVVERVETLLKKTVLRLSREHKSKLDSLPFSFSMSQNKKLVLTLDTRLLYSFGLGLGEINVRITPAIKLSISKYCLLPPLYAVPLIKSSASALSPSASTNRGAMARLFHASGISDLHWMIHTESLHTAILKDIEKQIGLDSMRSYHKECLMVLKALFSTSNHNKLLNKGEVDSYILYTVVSFLLQESPPLAWTLENLADRVSDAVHFLRSAYENAWLPELCIHNPHLVGKLPTLKVMDQILQGRQRNLLAHVTNQASLKVLDHISQRLSETRLARCINPHFSPDLWEYEFFMFG